MSAIIKIVGVNLTRLYKDDQGISIIEVALLMGLIAVLCMGAMNVFGVNLNLRWDDIGVAL